MAAENHFNRTRIAPTPSGYLHLGNILSFAITAKFAAQSGAEILLRIDDFDRERTNKLYIQDIFDTLNFLEIPWHSGPKNMQEYEQEYSQVHRTDLYNTGLQQLKESGEIFACTCSRTDVSRLSPESIYAGTCRDKHLPLAHTGVSWRIKTDHLRQLDVRTTNSTVAATVPLNMHDFIVKRRDGFPAYQLISVLDDIYFGVDLVVRGDDLWPSTVAQHYLAAHLHKSQFSNITFHHHPLINDHSGKKLSKSEGATSVHYLRQEHKTPQDIFHLIAHSLNLKEMPGSWQELTGMLPF